MTSRIKLDLPDKFPRWATDVGRTLEPDETGVAESNKDLGWLIDSEPPARKMNWLQNLAYEWIRQTAATQIMNWKPGTALNAASSTCILWDAVREVFVGVSATETELSDTGDEWTTAVVIGGAFAVTNLGRPAFNSTHMLLPAATGRILYSVDGAAWAADDTGTGNNTFSIDTKYPTSDLIIAGSVAGDIIIGAAGIAGGWAAPSVGPVLAGAPIITDIVNIDGTAVWYGASDDGEVFKSLDDGDNWANLTNAPVGFAAGFMWGMDINPTTGTIVVSGRTGAVAGGLIQYTTDDGASAWSTATIETNTLGNFSPQQFGRVRYCGGNMWICVSTVAAANGYSAFPVYISIDDGETWKQAQCTTNLGATAGLYPAISPKKILILHSNGNVIYSNSIIGT